MSRDELNSALSSYFANLNVPRSGIFPSNKTTYSLSQIENALEAQTGAIPYLGCGQNGTVLQEVWYFNHVLGTVSRLRPPHMNRAERRV